MEQHVGIGRYEQITFHRSGSCSTIYRAQLSSGKAAAGNLVALKVIDIRAISSPHNYRREAHILRKVASPYIIRLINIEEHIENFVTLVFPFIIYDLQYFHDRHMLSPNQARAALRSLFEALAHIHSLGVIHRDIKPSNILMQSPSGPTYLADFGVAWSDDNMLSEKMNEKFTDVGTSGYRPPELLFGSKHYGCNIDLWAAGCVVAELANESNETIFDSGPRNSELALISSIFRILGTPNIKTWPVSVFAEKRGIFANMARKRQVYLIGVRWILMNIDRSSGLKSYQKPRNKLEIW